MPVLSIHVAEGLSGTRQYRTCKEDMTILMVPYVVYIVVRLVQFYPEFYPRYNLVFSFQDKPLEIQGRVRT